MEGSIVKEDLITRLRSNIWLDAIRELADESAETIRQLSAKYDDAMKRIHDLTAELEHLRREVNRG
jgi:hypothetical protein